MTARVERGANAGGSLDDALEATRVLPEQNHRASVERQRVGGGFDGGHGNVRCVTLPHANGGYGS